MSLTITRQGRGIKVEVEVTGNDVRKYIDNTDPLEKLSLLKYLLERINLAEAEKVFKFTGETSDAEMLSGVINLYQARK